MVRRAAELITLAEQFRNQMLAGELASPNAFEQLTKLESESRRTLKMLGLDGKPEPPRVPTLADLLREDAAQRAEDGK
jgi:hypothetical protein